MAKTELPSRAQAAQHIKAALDTGVRGDIREYLQKALRASEGQKVTGLGKVHYDNLAIGAKLHDPDRPGLVMRHGKRSGRVWLYRHTDPISGKKVETQFGSYPGLSIADARQQWGEMRDAVQAGQSARPQATTTGAMTMAELVGKYLTEYAQPTKRSWRMDETYLTRHVLPHYGALHATEFTADHVRSILTPIWSAAPREAEKIRGVISSMFNVAIRGSRKIGNLSGQTWLPPTTVNPTTAVLLPQRTTESHTPTDRELTALLRALPAEGDLGEAIQLQAQTCARVTEVAALPWAELDLDAGTWLLPAARSKNGHAHLVMLSRQSCALLEARKASPAGKTPFVFPGARSAQHITRNSVGKAMQRIRTHTALPEGFTSHSLRHGCLTWLAEQQAGKEIRDRISNHVENTSSDAIYNAAALNQPARDWLQKWCDHLTGLEAENVIQLGARS